MRAGTATRLEVCVDLNGLLTVAGGAYVTERRGTVATDFSYAESYLADPAAVAISPDLPLGRPSRQHLVGLPGAFADGAPDRWGRTLIQRRLRSEWAAERSLLESDFLLGVSDLTRQGDLRYRLTTGGPFLATDARVPPLVELPRLLRAADAVAGSATDDLAAVKVLLDAGTGSLGGARPKTSVREGDELKIAKFPHPGDEWDVMAWEMTVLDLADRVGITTPGRRLVDLGGPRALLLDRFDRQGPHRRGFVSAMTLTGSRDGELADYLEVAEAIADHGTSVVSDLRQLWLRMAFSVAVNNTDDHLRNHGFLRSGAGWTLSPLFDVNPNPDVAAVRATSIGYETSRAGAVESLVRTAGEFELTTDEAEMQLEKVLSVTRNWRTVAAAHRIPVAEQERFAAAFTLD